MQLARGTASRSPGSSELPSWWRWSLMIAIGLLAAACTGGGDDPANNETAGAGAVTGDAQVEAPADAGASEAAGDDAVVVTAQAWLDDHYADAVDALRVEGVDETMGVRHVTFSQAYDDIPVLGGEIVVHVLPSGEVQNATDSLVDAEPGDAEPDVDEAGAVDFAEKAVTGTPEGESVAELVWTQEGTALRLGWRVIVATADPVGSWSVLIDAFDGGVIAASETVTDLRWGGRVGGPSAWIGASVGQGAGAAQADPGADACAVEAAPAGCIFQVDPIYAAALAGGELTDPGSANDFLTPVPLEGLTDETALVGEFANAAPDGAPVEPVREDDGTWATGRGGRGFEDVMAYYWVDYGQRVIQRLGFPDVRNESFPIFPLDPEVVDNAFYSGAEQAVHMGVGSDGIHESEDASGTLHEYGHAVLDAQVPGLLGGDEGGAYHESFGDLFAYFVTLEYRVGDPGCLFPWTSENQCLRRLDGTKVYPDDLANEVHLDGEIYNGAIYQVFSDLLAAQGLDIAACPGTNDCNELRDRVLATLLLGNSYLSADAGLQDVAQSFLSANEAAFADADADLIAAALSSRGFSGGGGEVVDSGGEPVGDAAAVSVGVDIGHSFRGDLAVSVGVVDAEFSDLCEPLILFEPDEADEADNLTGLIDVSDSDCAALVPPSPEQIWYLRVEDTLAEDEGEILGFTVFDGEDPYHAPGLPLPIADADPDGSFAIVDGTGEDVAPPGSEEVVETVEGDGPFVSVALTHSYVGDLQLAAGVADADGAIVCSVSLLEPDPSNNQADLAGDADVSECAGFYPPSPEQRWFLQVIDTAAADTGTVDEFSLTGPDGQTFGFEGLPAEIPDANVDGIALLLDGTGSTSGTAGGSGAGATTGLPGALISLTHAFSGDLAVTAGVLGPDGAPLCEIVVTTPDPGNGEPDFEAEASLEECAEFYPPTPEQPWFVFAADTLTGDTGTLDTFTLAGPDGVSYAAAGLPLELPDADPGGAVALLDGSEAGAGGGGTTTAPGGAVISFVISHPYAGDLQVVAGVVDASGSPVCLVPVQEADPANNAVDLSGDVALSVCGELPPPSPDAVYFVQAVDAAAADAGSIEAVVAVGPDGVLYESPDVPVAIPDNDPAGARATIAG